MLQLRFQSMRLRLRNELRFAGGTRMTERSLLRLLLSDGRHTGIGEAAPWTEAEFRQCVNDLHHAAQALAKAGDGEAAATLVHGLKTPSARFALHGALLDLEARRRAIRLATLLAADADDHVRINALVDLRTPDEAARRAAALFAGGYTCIKLKLGRPRFDDDLRVVEAVREAVPGIAIRLDANGAWNLADARRHIARLAPFNLDYLEQPCAAWTDVAALRDESPIALAVDESLSDLATAETLARERAAERWIVKPSRIGSLAETSRVLALAHENDIAVTLTHMLDGPIGLRTIVHAAAAWLPHEVHGLDADYGDDPSMPVSMRGTVHLDSLPGIGPAPDDAASTFSAAGAGADRG